MNHLPDILFEVARSLGLTILHSMWQGTIIVVMFLLALFLLRDKKLLVKYNVGLATLFLFLLSFVLTFFYFQSTVIDHEGTVPNADKLGFANFEIPGLTPDPVTSMTHLAINSENFFSVVIYIISAIWLVCFVFKLLVLTKAYFNLKNLKNDAFNTVSEKWQNVVNDIANWLKIKKEVKLLINPLVSSVIAYGFLKPVVIFPVKLFSSLSEQEIKSIVAHELAHIARNDYIFNILQNLAEAFLFYHPGVYIISKNIRSKREMLCDEIAVAYTGNTKTYIKALIVTQELSNAGLKVATGFNNNNKELLGRVKHLLNHKQQNVANKNLIIVLLLSFVLLCSSAYISRKSNNINNALSFNELVMQNMAITNAAVVVYDVNNKIYHQYNPEKCNIRYPAYSTYKVAATLFALESGVENKGNFTLQYDSIKYPLKDWMKNRNPYKYWYNSHNLESALKYSVNWFYQELNQIIGEEAYIDYLEKAGFGNKNIATDYKTSWLSGELQISGIEQITFLKNLNDKKLNGFSRLSQERTKQIMLDRKGENYKLYGKTGTGKLNEEEYIGWYVGIMETSSNTFVFALNITANSLQEIYKSNRQNSIVNIVNGLSSF